MVGARPSDLLPVTQVPEPGEDKTQAVGAHEA